MNTNHTQKIVLFLTWGTGNGEKEARSARGRKSAATRRRNTERAERAGRLARLRRDGGTKLSSGPVILLPLTTCPVARSIRRRSTRQDAIRPALSRASLALASQRGAEQAERQRVADATALRPSALAYLLATRQHEAAIESGEIGTAEARLALERLASDAISPEKIGGAERATLRTAKRTKARAERDLAQCIRPVFALTLAEAARPDIKLAGRERLADKFSILADASAHSFVRAWLANGGRELPASEVEELSAIYRARFARAATTSGLVPPDKRALYQRAGNALPFRALLAWQRAIRQGGTDCRSYLWGKGRELCDVTSTHDLERMRAVMMGADDERCWTVSSARSCQQEEPLEGEIEQEARAERAAGIRGSYVRRLSARWGDFLRVYWMLSGSRSWRSALASDLRWLATAARVSRGASVDCLPEARDGASFLGDGQAAPGSLRKAKHDLQTRIAAGRLLALDGGTSDAAEAVLEASKAARSASKAAQAAIARRVRAERLALEVVGSAM